jgi:RNA polymerase sigma-70 factor (ECF subfamily)
MALEALYRRTSAKLYGIALRVLGDPGAAEEVLQDVYVTVWNKASVFEAGRASAISWLAVPGRKKDPHRPCILEDFAGELKIFDRSNHG